MKKLSIIILTLALSVSIFAQKIGIVDSNAIFTGYSKAKNVQSQLQKEQEGYAKQYEAKVKDLEKLAQSLQAKGNNVTDSDKKLYESKVKSIEKFAVDTQKKLQDSSVSKMNAISKDVETAVQKVAKEKGLNTVVSKSGVIMGDSSMMVDITQDVLKKLN